MRSATRERKVVFLTGRPGVGKSSVVGEVVRSLRRRGLTVGGMTTAELRRAGVRVGFEVRDLASGTVGVLAHVEQMDGPRVGKYRVNLRDLEAIGARSIVSSLAVADLIVIDEVGPMELHSSAFKEAVVEALRSEKPILGTIHRNARDQLVERIRSDPVVRVIEVTHETRGALPEKLVKELSAEGEA